MKQVAVIGAGDCTKEEYHAAERVGGLLAENQVVLCCGGLGGVMEAASKGARAQGGTTVGIIPGISGENPYCGIVIRTGLGHARNIILVQSADVVIAIGGSYGTLSEVAASLKMGKPVFGYHTWEIPGVVACDTPEDAVIRAVGAGDLSLRYHIPQDGQGSR
ncbi:MAG: TIGR00725 family protein [Methanomicrobiales archaeon]|nr:TIGR00725 family protein [Methanomicrobiales archaeon]